LSLTKHQYINEIQRQVSDTNETQYTYATVEVGNAYQYL